MKEVKAKTASHVRFVRLLCAIPFFSPLAALSQDWQFGIGASTDQVRRGISYADGGLIEARVNSYVGNGWFFGMSGANVKSMQDDKTGVQIVADIGYGWPLASGWDAQLAVTHYDFLRDSQLRRFKYDDLTLTLDYRGAMFISVTGSPNTFYTTAYGQAGRGRVVSYDVMLRYPFSYGWSVNAGVGYSDLHSWADADYLYGNIAINLQLEQTQVSVSYIATDSTAKLRFGELAANRWVVGLWRYF